VPQLRVLLVRLPAALAVDPVLKSHFAQLQLDQQLLHRSSLLEVSLLLLLLLLLS
jgi:hypothetical protein